MSPNGSLIEEDHLSEVKDQNIEDQGRISDLFNQGKVPVFLISSVSLTMKTKYSNLIERLGEDFTLFIEVLEGLSTLLLQNLR